MKKLFSFTVYAVLSLIVVFSILYTSEATVSFQIIGALFATMIILITKLVLGPLRQGKLVVPHERFFVAMMYLFSLGTGVTTFLLGYGGVISPEMAASMEAGSYPATFSALVGIVFMSGAELLVPLLERRRVLRKLDRKVEQYKEDLVHID